MPLGRHRHPVGQPGGEHGPLPERRAPADREAAGLGRRGRVAAQGWPPVRGRVLIEGFVAVPLEVGAFRRDEYAGLLTPSRWRRPCLAPPHFLRVARGCPIHWRRVSKDKKPGFSTLTAGFLPALVTGEWSWTKAEKGGFLAGFHWQLTITIPPSPHPTVETRCRIPTF